MATQKIYEAFEAFHQKMGDTKEYFDLILGVMAFGIAIAQRDGKKISEDKKQELEELLFGISSSNLPQHIKVKIEQLYEKEISLEEALGFLHNIDPKNRKLIEDVYIIMTDYCGKDFTEKQKSFIEDYKTKQVGIPYRGETPKDS